MPLKLSPLEQNIECQPKSLRCVAERQLGDGRTALAEAAALVGAAQRVLITGIGASLHAATPFEYFLCSLGIDACTVEVAELLHYRHMAYRDALMLVVSRSGESVEVVRLLELLKGRQTILAVTNEPASMLAKSADVSLHIGSLADEMVAIQTYTGTLLTLYLLGCAVADRLAAASEEIEPLLRSFSASVASSRERSPHWDPFLESGAPIHLLARGPACASALEGALLFNEIAKIASIGMPIASFRHGPVELVDAGFRGIVFAQQGPTQALNIALAKDLVRFGGQVQVVGPSPAASGLDWHIIPEVPELLSPLFEIVPVQLAALRMAQIRGIAPGSFRYTPQVAVDEASFGPL